MFKLSLPGLVVLALLVALLLPAGTAAAESVADVEAMVAELSTAEYYSPDLCLRYKEYKDQQVEIISYIVKKGDNLISIAAAYSVSVATISASNNITNINLIFPGQKLVFPAVTGLLYTVAEGDELGAIAEKYQVDEETIWFANALDSDTLVPGNKIVLPGAKIIQSSPVKRTTSRGVATSAVNLATISMPGFIWPLQGNISSSFGMRGRSFHGGIDITSKAGKSIAAAAPGIVIASGWRGSYGYMVEIEHCSGVTSLYAHASKLLVKKGDTVEQGQTIARVGSTGYSTGPHLHFEIVVNGSQVNPRPLLP
jgi:murein DD-endopeptidase MepM/ murein hydrolase activator NlpD